MNTIQHSKRFLRKRKMMMALPLLVLPFITLGFWALGGGKASAATQKQATNEKGLNLQLPTPNLKVDNGLDKMSYYDMAEADSDKLKARMRNDSYFKLKTNLAGDTAGDKDEESDDDSSYNPGKKGLNVSPFNKKGNTDASEIKVYDKLKAINAALNNATASSRNSSASAANENKYTAYTTSKEPAINDQYADRLEKMMQTMKQDNSSSDPEMSQINSMLEKVMDIQHPERVNEKLKQNIPAKGSLFAVKIQDENINGFYSDNDVDTNTISQNAIEAVVHETQTLVNGAAVKLRLLNNVYINRILIPKDNFVFGKVSLAGERLTVSINSIRYENSLLPVAMSVYDMDGMDGIYIPGAITRDVAKQSTDNALQSVALNSLDPSIGAQAASAGIETAKTLISKKVKLVRVTVKAGYHVLLKDNNTNRQ